MSGPAAIRDAVATIAQHGVHSVLILTDTVLLEVDCSFALQDALKRAGIAFRIFSEIEPNPTVSTVHKAFEIFRLNKPDALIALGGGNVCECGNKERRRGSHSS